MKILTVVGARPQFIKAAWVRKALAEMGNNAPFEEILIHTGQHYDSNMSDIFFKELNIPHPHENFGIGSTTPARRIGKILEGLEAVLTKYRPDGILAYGDTDSTLAAAIFAIQNDLPFVHVEAGERVFRRHAVPEEINRVLSDNAATLCLAVTRTGKEFLIAEGLPVSA